MLRAVLATVALALVPATAHADTMVYRVEDDIWRMAGDGGGQRRMTNGGQPLEWPSGADDGTIVASDEFKRKLANAGTTTVRVKLRGPAVRTAKRLVLRASAAGATPVLTTIPPR